MTLAALQKTSYFGGVRPGLALLMALLSTSNAGCEIGEGLDDRGFFSTDASTGPGVDVGFTENATIQVQRVRDGDTIELSAGPGARTPDGKPMNGEVVRLLGVDAPEIAHPDQGTFADCWGDEAHAAARDLMAGRVVRLAYDSSSNLRDMYGRLLAYVTLPDDRVVNEVMIRQGHAHSFRAFAHRERDKYNQLEAQAEAEALNGWSACSW